MVVLHLDLSRLRILLADDSAFMRRLVRSLLNGIGIRSVIEAEDGAAALEAFEQNEIDIIITDWVMPVFDGLELTQAVRDPQSKNPHIPILMLSAHAELSRVILARDGGVNGFLTKPISAKRLRLHLESCVLNPRALAPASRSPIGEQDDTSSSGMLDATAQDTTVEDTTLEDDLTLGSV
ncbi:MAG: response regulator [Hyphomicrobiales bacterium]